VPDVTRGYIIGAGAQGRIIAEAWRAQAPSVALHFLDDKDSLQGRSVHEVPVVGAVEALATLDLAAAGVVLGIGDNGRRLELGRHWDAKGVPWVTVVHPSAVVMPSAVVGGGTVMFPQVVVNSGATVGQHVILNTAAIVEHDATIEDGVSLSPGVCMGGRVHIERGAFISTGVTIAPRVRIGAHTVVGAGATVIEDLPARVLAYGSPARVIRPLGDDFEFGRLL
jgi:sugar O-acyltransferase (sialic acid O-acetyltransferase NeuD family)